MDKVYAVYISWKTIKDIDLVIATSSQEACDICKCNRDLYSQPGVEVFAKEIMATAPVTVNSL